MTLTGNTILITGGGSGIGFEFARQLSEKNNTVIISGRNRQKLEAAKSRCPQLHTLVSDVSNDGELEAFFKKATQDFPKLNVLVNNAGIMRELNLHKSNGTLDELTQEIDTNLKAPIKLVQLFLPLLKKQPSAAIVNITSGLAFVPLPIAPIYCATKAALHSYTLSLRVQLKKTNVRVIEVAPPATKTELLDQMNMEDMKGVRIMNVDEMVTFSLAQWENGHDEIRPGPSNQLKFMSRLAPNFILGQLSKPVERLLNS
jgi:uncharacterized oxidoreductase